MGTLVPGSDVRQMNLGYRVAKSTGTLAATTVALFTVAGGRVAITSMYGIVTTAVTVANSYKLQFNPTDGTTVDMFAAADIGTTDTPAGDILTFTGESSGAVLNRGGVGELMRAPFAMTIGQIESVSAGTDGVINWVLTWIPLDDGASVEAA